jgi:hypothetical protein
VPAQPGPVVQPRVPEAEQRAASGTPRQKT